MNGKKDNKVQVFANITIGIGIVIFTAIFFYALARSHSHPSGVMIKYCVMSSMAITLLTFVLLRCPVNMKINISILMVSVCFMLYLAEIILQYHQGKSRQSRSIKLTQPLVKSYDARSKYQVMADLRKKGINAYVSSPPHLYISSNISGNRSTDIFPLGFISLKTTVHCNDSGEYLIYKSDEHGFNNPEGLYSSGKIDIVLIGDSFANGNCVNSGEDIAGRLRSTGRQVLNLGMSGNGPLIELATLKEYAKPLKPKFIFWLYYEGNDHLDLTVEKKLPLLKEYLNKDFNQDLFNKQKLIDNTLMKFMDSEIASYEGKKKTVNNNKPYSLEIVKHTIKLSLLRENIGLIKDLRSKKECNFMVDPLLGNIITEAKETVDSWGGKLYFVYLPDRERWGNKYNICSKRLYNTQKSQVLSLVKGLNISTIDMNDIFNSHHDPLSLFPFRVQPHYNAEGYSLVADQITKYLTGN